VSGQLDLFASLIPPCASCRHLDREPIESGVAYCHRLSTWERPDESGCEHWADLSAPTEWRMLPVAA